MVRLFFEAVEYVPVPLLSLQDRRAPLLLAACGELPWGGVDLRGIVEISNGYLLKAFDELGLLGDELWHFVCNVAGLTGRSLRRGLRSFGSDLLGNSVHFRLGLNFLNYAVTFSI